MSNTYPRLSQKPDYRSCRHSSFVNPNSHEVEKTMRKIALLTLLSIAGFSLATRIAYALESPPPAPPTTQQKSAEQEKKEEAARRSGKSLKETDQPLGNRPDLVPPPSTPTAPDLRGMTPEQVNCWLSVNYDATKKEQCMGGKTPDPPAQAQGSPVNTDSGKDPQSREKPGDGGHRDLHAASETEIKNSPKTPEPPRPTQPISAQQAAASSGRVWNQDTMLVGIGAGAAALGAGLLVGPAVGLGTAGVGVAALGATNWIINGAPWRFGAHWSFPVWVIVMAIAFGALGFLLPGGGVVMGLVGLAEGFILGLLPAFEYGSQPKAQQPAKEPEPAEEKKDKKEEAAKVA